ncbi:hypothetical protein SCHPADRAFT_886225 [Schizopora paradoxa]|uniref:Uncharacterized protein n=1 Tax=Schizopora paradoxa TaxID=27342 RepID=A0A0H2S3G6_9AGAM|nr:hypothetical protein SCHPADRAFT_886225 [Schizopora paradoxa]
MACWNYCGLVKSTSLDRKLVAVVGKSRGAYSTQTRRKLGRNISCAVEREWFGEGDDADIRQYMNVEEFYILIKRGGLAEACAETSLPDDSILIVCLLTAAHTSCSSVGIVGLVSGRLKVRLGPVESQEKGYFEVRYRRRQVWYLGVQLKAMKECDMRFRHKFLVPKASSFTSMAELVDDPYCSRFAAGKS